MAIQKVGFRHLECHHSDITPDIESAVMLLEKVAVLVHEDSKVHRMTLYGVPWRVDNLGLVGGVVAQTELYLGIYHSYTGIESIQLGIDLRMALRRAESQSTKYQYSRKFPHSLSMEMDAVKRHLALGCNEKQHSLPGRVVQPHLPLHHIRRS